MKFFLFFSIKISLILIFILSCTENYSTKPKLTDEELYESKCSRCHELYPPSHFNDSDWEFQLDVEIERANLNSHEKNRILRYLQSNNND